MKNPAKHNTRNSVMTEEAKESLIQGIYAMKLLENALKKKRRKKSRISK